MAQLGDTVIFVPHNEHSQFADFQALAAIVGHVHEDNANSLDLYVLTPNKESVWMDKVPQAAQEGPGHFHWLHDWEHYCSWKAWSDRKATKPEGDLLSAEGMAIAAAANAGAGGWGAPVAIAGTVDSATGAITHNPPEPVDQSGGGNPAAPAAGDQTTASVQAAPQPAPATATADPAALPASA
jgi:hypothetical protein